MGFLIIQDLIEPIRIDHCNLLHLTIFYKHSDLLAKRQSNQFLIPFQSTQEQEKELLPLSGISIDISIKGVFRKNNIFLLISTILGTKERVHEL
ncbi:hypothetical protein Pint_16827 [Pistacia integerrima]|uniref:Uncharacterized protein n=1 Tax=Pistacia integerrima TaxID=434235 RepID=A0ACC0Z8U8_9ROSI|nr:hypothetical protein Pint_16827 [Pistacia integerrima]